MYAFTLLIGAFLFLPVAQSATREQAKAITQTFDQKYKLWQSEMILAKSAGAVKQVSMKRPDATAAAKRLKLLIQRDLAQDWTLEFGAWLLENDPKLLPKQQRALLNAVEKYHIKSPHVGRFCMAMVYLNQGGELPRLGQPPIRTRGMKLLEEIKKKNPDPKVQGLAALSLSILISDLGDDPRIIRRRILNIKEAIIKSAEVKVGEVTVADIAADELYKIKYLSKGRVAPDIKGFDASFAPLQLSSFRGKVVILVFWSSTDPEAGHMFEILRKEVSDNVGKPIVVLGVNRDDIQKLRSLKKDDLVTWRNFSDADQKIAKAYRIARWPFCMVIDQNGVIQYRGNIGSFAEAVADSLILPKSPKSPKR